MFQRIDQMQPSKNPAGVSVPARKKYREFNFENLYRNFEYHDKSVKNVIGGFQIFDDDDEKLSQRRSLNSQRNQSARRSRSSSIQETVEVINGVEISKVIRKQGSQKNHPTIPCQIGRLPPLAAKIHSPSNTCSKQLNYHTINSVCRISARSKTPAKISQQILRQTPEKIFSPSQKLLGLDCSLTESYCIEKAHHISHSKHQPKIPFKELSTMSNLKEAIESEVIFSAKNVGRDSQRLSRENIKPVPDRVDVPRRRLGNPMLMPFEYQRDQQYQFFR